MDTRLLVVRSALSGTDDFKAEDHPLKMTNDLEDLPPASLQKMSREFDNLSMRIDEDQSTILLTSLACPMGQHRKILTSELNMRRGQICSSNFDSGAEGKLRRGLPRTSSECRGGPFPDAEDHHR